jgi:type IV pilus assembly protein PilB
MVPPMPIQPADRDHDARPTDHSIRLGEHLIDAGLATVEQVDFALAEQAKTGERLGDILVTHGILFEEDLARTLATIFGLPYRNLDVQPPDPAATPAIPEGFCRRRCVLPMEITEGELTVAVADPRDVQTIDDLRIVVSMPFHLVVAPEEKLRRAIDSAWQTSLITLEEPPVAGPRESDVAAGAAEANLAHNDGLPENEGPVVRLVNQVLQRAISERASDLHLEPTENGLRIRFRVDGMLHDVMNTPASFQLGVISRVKIMTGMDITEHRRPQDGRVSIAAEGIAVDVRAASLPTIYGEALVLRLLHKEQGLLNINELGFLPDALARYKKSYSKPWGMVLVTGPTGSGKSTTLYATVNELNVASRNTITVEDPIEYRVAGIKQTQVNLRVGYTFASGLRAALRSDPDVLLIGEIRDLETARIAAESALTGHLVLSTLHAHDAASSAVRLLDMGLEPYRVTSSLECIVAQRLLRQLCRRCKTEGAARPDEVLELSAMSLIDDAGGDVLVHRAIGCAECGGTGYRGRLAVHEALVMDEALKTLVLERAPAGTIARAAVAGGMHTLQQDAFAKVRAGETSLDECKRVLA